MVDLVLALNAAGVVFAILFIVVYGRILLRARLIGPTPTSWIMIAVGTGLIAAYALLEVMRGMIDADIVFHTERVYFMLGNMIVAAVLLRIWRTVGGTNDTE